jgi:eukaryotic-like serine/threonine-protein kinase
MEAPVLPKRVYRFGLFQADPENGKLLRQGVPVKLQDQPLRVLCLLLDRPGEIITREELQQSLWPEGTYVEFDGSLNAALKKLRYALGDDAEHPIFIETVPRRGYRFLAPVSLEAGYKKAETLTPADQHLDAGAAAKTSAPAITPPVQRPLPRFYHFYIVAGIALLTVMGLIWFPTHRRQSNSFNLTQANAQVPIRRSVAVLGFHNASARPQDDWLATAVSEMLSTELATGEKLRVVSGEEVANLRISSPWSQTSTLGPDTTARIGTALNSDILVLGSYTVIGAADHGQLRFDVRLQDARTGNVLSQIAQTGNGSDLFHVASEIGARLRQQLGVPAIKDTEQSGVLASLPLDRDCARVYALGIAKLRDFDALAAKDLLEQAVKADPKFPLAHLMLARAWSDLGYEQKRKEEAKKALDLSTDLPRMQRMQIEGDYHESLPDHEKAASTYRALFELFPDNVDYGLQLAAAQKAAGNDSQAGQTIAQLRRLPPPASDDPRIDLVDEPFPKNIPAALALERNAMRKAEAQGKKLLYAQAEKLECMNLNYSDHPEQASSACEDAYNLFLAAGNRLAAADTVRLSADNQGALGHLGQAISTYQKALNILQGLGEHEKTGAILNNMAINFENEGKLDRSEELYRQARFQFEQAGDKPNMAVTIGNIADILYERGKLAAAEKLYRQAIEVQTSRDGGNAAYAWYRLADLELTQGRVREAHKLAQQAVDAYRVEHGAYQYLSAAINMLGDVLKTEANSAAARQQYQSALDIRQKAGEPVAESSVELADLALDEGRPDQAEPLLRAAIAEFEKEKADPDSASAYIELSRTLLMEGKLEDARKALQQAADLSRTSPDPALKLPIAIQSARVTLTAVRLNEHGRPGLAAVRQQLRSTIDTARKLGYYGEECEARLVLGELEMKANPELGRSILTQLADETDRRGMELVAKKALALGAA